MACQPGQTVGDPATTQFFCPPESSYYRERALFNQAAQVEGRITNQDSQMANLRGLSADLVSDISQLFSQKEGFDNTAQYASASADLTKLNNNAGDTYETYSTTKTEDAALADALDGSQRMADLLYTASQPLTDSTINTKTRLIAINQAAFEQKRTLVTRLSFLIYFMLYGIVVGVATAVGVISTRALGVMLLLGMVSLTVGLFMQEDFWKTYGDLSMEAAKGATRQFIKVAAPIKECPPRCVRKGPPIPTDGTGDDGGPWTAKLGVMPYDYKVDDPGAANSFFRRTTNKYRCKRMDDGTDVIDSDIPCNYYVDRTTA
jgi:hypothetical protein